MATLQLSRQFITSLSTAALGLAISASAAWAQAAQPSIAPPVADAGPTNTKAAIERRTYVRTTLPPLNSPGMATEPGPMFNPAPIDFLAPKPAPLEMHKQVGVVNHVIPVYVRLGAEVSPRLKFDGGVDVDVPGLSLGRGMSTRIDADVILTANLGGTRTLIPLTFDQVFSRGLGGVSTFYLGAGIGPYFGSVTRFGGKIFAGANLARRIGIEGAVHFPGWGDPLFTLQLRTPLG